MLDFFLNLLLRRIMITNFYFQISMRTHFWHTAFTTLRIELYRVVDYASKCSTKFHKDCMLEFLLTLLSRRLMIIF